jgi:hypothetical protein
MYSRILSAAQTQSIPLVENVAAKIKPEDRYTRVGRDRSPDGQRDLALWEVDLQTCHVSTLLCHRLPHFENIAVAWIDPVES